MSRNESLQNIVRSGAELGECSNGSWELVNHSRGREGNKVARYYLMKKGRSANETAVRQARQSASEHIAGVSAGSCKGSNYGTL